MGTELQNRMGWHGIKTRRQGFIVLFLMFLHRRTHYINVRNRAATGFPRCMLDINFSVADLVYVLAHLENLLVDDEVLSTLEFQVKGTAAGSDGVRIALDKCLQVTLPVPVPRRKAMAGRSPTMTVSLLW